jgi:hypothetical protein
VSERAGGRACDRSILYSSLEMTSADNWTQVILGTPLKEGKRLGVPVPTLLTYDNLFA